MIWNSKGLVFGSVLAAQKGRDEPGGVSPTPLETTRLLQGNNHGHIGSSGNLAMAYIVWHECGPGQSILLGTHELRLRGFGFLGQFPTFCHHE